MTSKAVGGGTTAACLVGGGTTAACLVGGGTTAACLVGGGTTAACLVGGGTTAACLVGGGTTAACLVGAALALAVSAASAFAAPPIPPPPVAERALMPQARLSPEMAGRIAVADVAVQVDINDQASTTVMDISLRNDTAARQEMELLVPAPDAAVVRGFTYPGAPRDASATVLAGPEARSACEAVVARTGDPALLEFISYGLIRTSLFAVEAGGTQKLHLTWENALPADGDRVDYLLPRTESVAYSVPWKISVSIASKSPISTVYSPSHKLNAERKDERHVVASLAADATTVPGPFRLSYLRQREGRYSAPGDGVTASLFACPDARSGNGYFLFLAGLPARVGWPEGGHGERGGVPRSMQPQAALLRGVPLPIKRELTLVLDHSANMRGDNKLDQVREAARRVVADLKPGERFNIIAYNDKLGLFATEPVGKSDETARQARDYLNEVEARGRTNIYDALAEALRPKPARGALPIVLFLTDGLPTAGNTSEVAICDLAVKANPFHRRIFTFGVGYDVNTPLLERLARQTGGRATFVLPSEDIGFRVSQVFADLAGPVFADPQLTIRRESERGGVPLPAGAQPPVSDVLPARLPDLFEGDQLVVLGRYAGTQPLQFTLSGNYLGSERAFRFDFDMSRASARNGFVAVLWAGRKIATLIDAIRELGADAAPQTLKSLPAADPKLKALTDEVVRLSAEYGILTEYTALLARDPADRPSLESVEDAARASFEQRAMRTRYGIGAVSQGINTAALRDQQSLNPRNSYLDSSLNIVSIPSVQQFNGAAFFQRGDRWVDGLLLGSGTPPLSGSGTPPLSLKAAEARPPKVVARDSKEFKALTDRLAGEHREGALSLKGDVLLDVDREAVLVKDTGSKDKEEAR